MSKVRRLPKSLVAHFPKVIHWEPGELERIDAEYDRESKERMERAAKWPEFQKIARRYRKK